MLYLDTSALLKLYIRETGSEAVHSLVVSQDLPLAIWDIQEAEFINALRLKVFWKEITPEQADEQISLFQERWKRGFHHFPAIDRTALMETYRRLSAETPRLGCRTMDILHVACAVEIGASAFLTFDKRQAELARFAGLDVPVIPIL
jgi:predicted nucleic acid-binding protein